MHSDYLKAQSQGTIPAYEKFLHKYPSSVTYGKDARLQLEKLRFTEAIESGDEKGLEALLERPVDPKNPFSSQYLAEGKETLARIKAGRLKNSESMEGYRTFYSKFEGTTAARELEDSYEQFYGAFALSGRNLEDYAGYITRFPRGSHAAAARERGEEIWWSEKSDSAGVADYQQYLDLFPEGPHLGHVRGELERMMWAGAEDTATDSDLYLSYLERFPEGAHNLEARDCVDWAAAERKGPEAIRSYLKAHPDGRFSSRADEILRSADQVDEAMNKRIWDAVWEKVQSNLKMGGRWPGGKEYMIQGWIQAGDTFLSYSGITEEEGNYRVLLDNHSRYDMSGTVYEHYDGKWYPVYKRYFKTGEGN